MKQNILKTISAILFIGSTIGAYAASAKYGPYEDNTFVFCRPPGQVKVAAVLVHGGWWKSGSDENGGAVYTCQSLAARGILIMSINYRLTVGSGNKKGWGWPAQLQDAQRAVRALRVWMPSIPVGIVGTSAGGHIALMTALYKSTMIWPETDPSQEFKWSSGVSSRPDFVVDIAGPVDLTNADLLQSAVSNLISGLPMTLEKAKTFTSPIMHVGGDAPPMFIMHGVQDTAIPFIDVPGFVTILNTAGVPNKFVQTPGGHVFSKLTPAQVSGYMDEIAGWIFTIGRR